MGILTYEDGFLHWVAASFAAGLDTAAISQKFQRPEPLIERALHVVQDRRYAARVSGIGD